MRVHTQVINLIASNNNSARHGASRYWKLPVMLTYQEGLFIKRKDRKDGFSVDLVNVLGHGEVKGAEATDQAEYS